MLHPSINTQLEVRDQLPIMPLVRNPILPGFNADPSVLRVADDGKQRPLSYLRCFVLTLSRMY
jgi:hypothetical protein